MMGFEIVMLLFEAQMVVIVLEIIASGSNSVIMAMETTCSVSLTLCTLSILVIATYDGEGPPGGPSTRTQTSMAALIPRMAFVSEGSIALVSRLSLIAELAMRAWRHFRLQFLNFDIQFFHSCVTPFLH